MKALNRLSLLLLLLPGSTLSAAASSPKPYHRALVISGENINTPLFLGMADGAEDAGMKPDLLVASCGASLAVATLQAVPDRPARLAFLTSRSYYELLKGIQLDDPSLVAFGERLLGLKNQAGKQARVARNGQRWVPDIFSYSLVRLANEFSRVPELGYDLPFSRTGQRAVIVAAKVEFSPAEVNRYVPSWKKLFTETLFTDPDTAGYLTGFPSLVGDSIATSSLNPTAEIISDATVGEASRASITDPLLVNPVEFRGSYYLTGAVNIDPVNIATQLADEVIARYAAPYDSLIEEPALMGVFAFDGNAVRKQVLESGKVDYWIDGTGAYPNMSFGAQRNFKGALESLNLARTFKFGSGIPSTYEEFMALVTAQYKYGYQKTREAFAHPRGDLSHIAHRD